MAKHLFYILILITSISNANCQVQLNQLNIDSGEWIEIDIFDSDLNSEYSATLFITHINSIDSCDSFLGKNNIVEYETLFISDDSTITVFRYEKKYIMINISTDANDGYRNGTINEKGFVKLIYRSDTSQLEYKIINILFDCKVLFSNGFISKATMELEKQKLKEILKEEFEH